LPSPVATTDSSGNFTLAGAPNGHYLLIIGTDTVMPVPPGYTTPAPCGACPTPTAVPGTSEQATVHDNITLFGGNQTLSAPTLPTVPAGYTAPAWEKGGAYRLATLDSTTEMPCYVAWQYQRQQRSLPLGSVDEWLVENVRANNAYAAVAPPGATFNKITQGAANSSGGTSCVGTVVSPSVFSGNQNAVDLRTLWFAGQFNYATAYGFAEFPVDPRSATDSVLATWP
jgi:hypothetical protein